MKKILLIACGLTLASAVEAQIIRVPGDYPTIQQGINAAAPGDTVLVAEGTYYENINFLGIKPLIVASEFLMDEDTSHISNTIINGSQPLDPDIGSAVTLNSGEDTTSVLVGFTVTGGTGTMVTEWSDRAGGGVFIQYCGGKLLNNYIEYNNVSYEGWTNGGGIYAGDQITTIPWVVIRNNRICNNEAISLNNTAEGGGVECNYNLIMEDNQISYNSANGHLGGDGGGVAINGYAPITIDVNGNEITHNEAVSDLGTTNYATLGGGMGIYFSVTGSISDNDISFNSLDAPGSYRSWGPGIFIEYIPSIGFVFENNLVKQNYAVTTQNCHGGGVSLYGSGGLYQNNVIQNNSASYGGGIKIAYSKAVFDTALIINNTITGNTATFGGGIDVKNSDAVLINSIIWGNTAPSEASIHTEASTIEVRYSDVESDDVWPGEGNMNIEPPFDNDGYHLYGMPSILNTGITEILINGVMYHCPESDIDGDARPYQNQPEIGVDEVTFESVGELIPTDGLTINVYPNPCNDILTVSTSNGEKMDEIIINFQTGQEIMRQALTAPTTQVDISHLPTGLYFMKVTCNKTVQVVKLVKE